MSAPEPTGHPTTRRELLTAGAAAAAALGAAGLSPPTALALATAGAPDPPGERLARLLSVELLLLFCYQNVLGGSFLTARARPALVLLRRHEQAHVNALAGELPRLGATGSAPAAPASVTAADRDLARRNVTGRLGQLRGQKDALHLLLELERVVTGAYFVALTKLDDQRLITLSLSIMAAEAQHEALIGELLYPGDVQRSVPYGLIQGIQ